MSAQPAGITLYSGPLSMFGAKVQIAALEKGLDFDLVMVPYDSRLGYYPKHAEVLRVNPKGQVPVLVHGDLELFDSTQIFEYLEDLQPTPGLWPSDIVDRARAMEDVLRRPDLTQDGRDLHGVLSVLARRARYINAAITLITLSALFISLVVVMLFVNAFLRWDLSVFIACMFILSMLSLAAALSAFLVEVRVATNTLQIGIEAAEAADAASRHDE